MLNNLGLHDSYISPLTLRKTFNPPSVASATGEETSNNLLGHTSLFDNIQSVRNNQEMDTQLSTPSDRHQQTTSPSTTQQREPPQQPASPTPRISTAATVDLL